MGQKDMYISYGLLLFTCSCAAQAGRYSAVPYEEDLSAVRAEVALEVLSKTNAEFDSARASFPAWQETTGNRTAHTVNEQVSEVLDSIAKLNKRIRHTNGYTIKIYSGQSRQEALSIKAKVLANTGNEHFKILLQYDQPNFLVTAGEYFSRLEAQKDLLDIKQHFSKAILVPKKILLQ